MKLGTIPRLRGNPAHKIGRRSIRSRVGVFIVSVVLPAGLLVTAGPTPAGAVDVYPVTTSGSWTVVGHGNGHGHGLSQYGARGAAARGLTAAQIIAFYYQGTTIAAVGQTTVRVLLAGSGTEVTIAAGPGMYLGYPGGSLGLPTNLAADKWRLIPSGAGLALQYHKAAGWVTLRTGLPAQADFHVPYSAQYFSPSGAKSYRGTIGAVRSGNSLLTINRVTLDAYAYGVVAAEMPASWAPAAVQAQAIAARSYAQYAVEHNGAAAYDICDTTQCQVYGGLATEQVAATVAVNATATQVVRYAGQTAFTQYSADDGGWTTNGGKPYLVAKADPYEAYADSPWYQWTRTVTKTQLATAYGLRSVTALRVLSRDGNGALGGRILTAAVDGAATSGAATSVTTTGDALASALGLPHAWFAFEVAPPGAPTSVKTAVADGTATVTWAPPTVAGTSAITGYSVTAGSVRHVLAANARSDRLVGLANGVQSAVVVRAINAAGEGPGVTATVQPVAAPGAYNAVPAAFLVNTSTSKRALTPTQPFDFSLAGHANIPLTAQRVVLTVYVLAPQVAGTLKVFALGAPNPVTSSFHYRPGGTNVFTAMVSLQPSKSVRFVPSAGSIYLAVGQAGYIGASGQRLSAVPPTTLIDLPSVGTGIGTAVLVRGRAGVPATATSAIVQVTARSSATAPAAIRVFSAGAVVPGGSHLSVNPGLPAVTTVVVPIAGNGTIRIASSLRLVGATLTVVGYGETAARGDLVEIQQPIPIIDFDGVGGARRVVTPTGTWFQAAGGASPVPAAAPAAFVYVTLSPTTSGVLQLTGADSVPISIPFKAGNPDSVMVLLRPGIHGGVVARTTAGTITIGVTAAGYLAAG